MWSDMLHVNQHGIQLNGSWCECNTQKQCNILYSICSDVVKLKYEYFISR